MRELVILTADGTMNAVFKAFFERPMWHLTLQCGTFDIWAEEDIFNLPGKTDGQLHKNAHELLRPYQRTHIRALVVLDQQFGGERPAEEIRQEILRNLNRSGWDDRCEVVVIDPELEVWLWQDKPQIAQAVRFPGGSLRNHLREEGLWPQDQHKPDMPKKTIQALMKQHRAGAPIVVYPKIAKSVGVSGCQDSAFGIFRERMQAWFPAEDA